MSIPYISFEQGEAHITWHGLIAALEAGHHLPKAEVDDTFLYRGGDTLLSRAAWIDGLGSLVKTAMIFPQNPSQDRPMINGAVTLFDDKTGEASALVDFHLVTKWKTAGDSLLAATKLARQDAEDILVLGAGTVGASLIDGYRSLFPNATIRLWNRNADKAKQMAEAKGIEWAPDLPTAVTQADIISSATMSSTPFIDGAWLRSGQHLDLIGAYRPDMREANDLALRRSDIFVDSRATTMGHIGELKIPLETGVIAPEDVIADYYDHSAFERRSDDAITLFKNGGGAHLDLMTAAYILRACNM